MAHIGNNAVALLSCAKLETIATMGSRMEARAVEQALIQNHGLAKNGGTLANKINSISPRNPAFSRLVEFGLEVFAERRPPILG